MSGFFIPVREYTTTNVLTVQRTASVGRVIKLMDEYDIRHVPVVKDDRAVGMVSDHEIRPLLKGADMENEMVGIYMNQDILTIQENSRLVDVVYQLSDRKFDSAVVTNYHEEIVGIFTITDALNALIDSLRGQIYEDPDSLIV